jgi:hypothetical protein
LKKFSFFRTSQIIAQLPREPPPELLDEEDEKGANFFIGHIPPPPGRPSPLCLFPIYIQKDCFPKKFCVEK